MFRNFFYIIFIVIAIIITQCQSFNPYHVLEVKKSATISEIKRSYKILAKKFHPDKNQDVDAEDKFIELNKAYEILMDPDRRRLFDKTGQTEDTPNFKPNRDYRDYPEFKFDTFQTYFDTDKNGQNGFRFWNFGKFFSEHSITYKAYENNILPQSYRRVYIIVFYGDLCIPCIQVEKIFKKLWEELEPIGVVLSTVHTQHEIALTRKIGVRSLPYIISLVEGDIRIYRDTEISLSSMISFIKRSLPSNLVQEIDDRNYLEFLNGWQDNKMRAIFINNDRIIRLRYLLIAFNFYERIVFGRVKINDLNSEEILKRYHIDTKLNSLLIFNEDINNPQASLSLSELKRQIMYDVLDSNKYLFLPRITSQEMFDQICTVGTPAILCVMLISSEKDYSIDLKLQEMRQFMHENDFSKKIFRFMFVFKEKQPELVKSLTDNYKFKKANNINKGIHIVIIWRKESNSVLYEWLENEWDLIDQSYINETKQKLHSLMNKLSKNTAAFIHSAKIHQLKNESTKSLFARIVKRLLLVTENFSDISRTNLTPLLTGIFSLIFIIFVGYVMTYFMKIEEESIREKYRKMGRQVPGSTSSSSSTRPRTECKLNIHELRGETYNGLIRLLKPGCRTIVLFCDNSSKTKLLPQFYKAVYPYRKNKTLMFAFLLVEKNIDWYKKLLLQTLGDDRDLNINPKNCIGTVISINGFRKYFCVYHAKHPENHQQQTTTTTSSISTTRRDLIEENGEFLGLNDTNSDQESDVESGMLVNHNHHQNHDQNNEVIFESNLLNGLPNWLDKLFDGTTTRYYINFWPEHMK